MHRDLRSGSGLRSTLFGDRAFYRIVLAILIPIIIQNAITNFVNLLDNIMVGQVGTEQMSGVSIANQLMFVFNLCVFGGLAGAGIFSAQFFGAGNRDGVQSCFRYKLCLGLALVAGGVAILLVGDRALISRFLHDETGATGRIDATLGYGLDYLHVMLWGLAPFMLTQAYASTLRECGETRLPMFAGITAVFVNLFFNYLLIFGHLGFPRLGVVGAAIATVISRYVELCIVVISTHRSPEKYSFAPGLYRTLRIPKKLVRDIMIKGFPLLINEALWSIGMTKLTQLYSLRGLDVVAALNISSTVSNLFSVTFISMGNATAIIVGQSLGANDLEGARRQAWRLIVFSALLSTATALLMVPIAPFVPRVYQTSDAVRALSTRLIYIFALCMPLFSCANCSYFILRSGGKTLLTFLFDSVFTWAVCVPLAWCLVHLTPMSVTLVYLCVQLADIIKCSLGFAMIGKGVWLNNIVGSTK